MGRWEDVPVDDSLMRCYLTKPQAVYGPGVLVCMHGPGVDEFIRDICERLASSGFGAIAPDLYHRQREPRVEPWTKIRDSEALHHTANNPALRAAVVFHGGNIMVAGEGLPSPFEQARNIRAPVLGLFGSEDENPSPADVQKIDAELTRLGKAHEFHSFAGAGHAFLNFTRPTVFREAPSQEAWAK